ncbi:LRR receptor-like serine/threonine-protein kinase IOS1, partial [Mucuna pruriens]
MKIYNASIDRNKEIIYVPSRDYVQICLVDTGYGTPFISSIELRTLNNSIYVTELGSLQKYYRWDLGSDDGYRYKDDVYDRFWNTYGDNSDWRTLSVSIPSDSLDQNQNDYKLPAIVMSTAVAPVNANSPLLISWEPEDQTEQFFVYMHFMEIRVLAKNQTREFSITENGDLWYENFSPQYLGVDTIQSTYAISGKEIKYSLEMTKNSTLPPIINAIEIYRIIDFQQSDTFQGDVDAITTIKSVYGVTRDWQGDPCAPVAYLWDGLNCTFRGNESPRITTLDLSNNSLTGEIPDFLSQLQYLKILNLEKNKLSGSIPSALVEKSKDGSLSLSVDLCEPGQCNDQKKKRKSIVTPLVASVSGILILLVTVAVILWNLKRRKSKALMVEKDQSQISPQYTEQDDSLLQVKKQIYSYSDVLKMTNNFNTIVGKGGFGTVYLGYIDETPVAVKMLSPSSVHGYQQFQAEVKVLMRVHHKNLTSLIGYCNEGTNKGLIYEYMANGNLQEHLSGKRSKTKFLSWEDRLRIAVDAASGLEYLQNGCKPPIFHRDVKTTNILLNEHFQAKLSDFGLSKIIPTEGSTHVSTVIAGTPGYVDPEYYITNRLTDKSDVYSFGIVVLEIITSQPVIGRNPEKIHISEWVSSLIAKGDIKGIVDSRLDGDFDSNSVWKAVEIATACVSPNPNKRPFISVIVSELKESLAMELARTKYSGADSRDSVKPMTMNLNTEFIPQASIDCGAPADASYTEPNLGINYTSDANFTNSGVSGTIVSELKSDYIQPLWTLRSFPEGKRNCYKINITRGSKYLIFARFLYGNYDGLNKLPQFDILLGANRWVTVTIYNTSVSQREEIIHVPSLDYIHICLVDTGFGTPFISSLELRTLRNDIYDSEFGSLERYMRCNLGSNESYRYNYDVYDRLWSTCNFYQDWTPLSVSIPNDSLVPNYYQLPAIVMSTAVTPANASAPLVIRWEPQNPTDQFYVYLHFTEIQVLPTNQTRQFNIIRNGETKFPNLSPRYLGVNTIYTESAINGKEIKYSLEMTKNSTLPPIINAIEIYRVIDFPQSDTYQGDVDAITTIKSVYRVAKDWQGDPCGPVAYLWDGLNCTYRGNDSPRITSLNLSSSGLSGQIDLSISKLTMLENLDLSNNRLNGEVPNFLSQLQHLKILNLEKNNLSGSIPSVLVEKSKEGSLLLSVDQNPDLCESGQCNENKKGKKKKSIVRPLVASISGVVILLVVVAAILWTLKRRKSKALMVEKDQSQISPQYTEQDDSLLQSKKQIFSYSDVLRITNNFDTIVGKGGFGTVYLGYINDTPVAVKMLSPSSVHGYQQFQAEVKLLMRVHHKNLTSLIGYCNEETNKGLIYEYMANGNLQEHLSGKRSKTKFLSWEDRLRIAVDAASGLEYLQNGCKPPIFHRDVKTTNILLNEHFQAKLSDFGLSKIIPTDGSTHVSTVIAGTPGYLDPEYYITNRLTEKSDVYSFGVVLLEIVTSKPVIAKNEEKSHISQWVSSLIAKGDIKGIVDSRLEGDFDSNSVWKAVEIATACVSPNPNRRPIISVIVTELKESLAMELARTKYRGAYTEDSLKLVTMNLNTEFIPKARMSSSCPSDSSSGPISIDCGAPNVNYTESTTGIYYTSDVNFINSGVSRNIASELKNGYQQQAWYVRSFPEGVRNCYKINITRGSKYLIRTGFLYGNYDGLNMLPQFDLLLGANRWTTVTIYNASLDQFNEIIYVPSLDYVQLCLVDTGHGTPFVSAIELRTLKNDIYATRFGLLETYYRWDLGSNGSYRYKYDVYDRFWSAFGHNKDWTQLSVSIPADSLGQNDYKPPEIVMSTVVTSVNASAPLVIRWEPKNQTDQFYVYMHFTEIQVLAKNQTREFIITQNGKPWYQKFSPPNQTVYTIYSTSAISGKEIKYSLEKTKSSALPPIINAMEIYRFIEFQQSDTFQRDVDAITTIKSVYGVTRDWQGDPCAPVAYLWDGLNCTYGENESPRITNLDLSNNNLNGEVPDFLSQLQHLKILNLEKNNLSGSIPSPLVEKSREGSLSLSMGQNPYLCQSGQCNEKRKEKEEKKNIVTPLVASVSGVVILLVVVAAILWTLKRRKSKALKVEKDQSQISPQSTEQDDPLLQSKKQKYSYSDVVKITNNFKTTVGKGGFGSVYLGYIDDTPVAVKMLSQSSVHGYQQFQAEVKLLMRVHHKNLTSLVGYCNEETNKGLIYEYMANGNLQEHLSGKHSKTKFFSWEERLRIAVNAASGLEYLQNGCKPPIIHRDVKTTNILLNEHFQAKLSDFGLSKIIPADGSTHVSTVIAGTPGYLDPEYFITNRLTEKSDVYSFGVVLLEIITSQPVIARNQEKSHISEWVSSLVAKGDIEAIVDSRLEGDFDTNSVWKAVEIATASVSPNPNRRPIISVILIELKESLAMELARTKYRGAGTRYSVNPVTMNLNPEFNPQARFRSLISLSRILGLLIVLGTYALPPFTGFISIDCGLVDEPSYTDETTSIYYSSDVNFTDGGVSHSISPQYKASLHSQFWNVRSFPDGTRNCYTIAVPQGSGKKYLVRARFAYGNYDGKDTLPEFDIYLGASWWGSPVFEDASSVVTKEIIYSASSDYVHVCLFNTGKGTPFISVLELRVLNSDAYLINYGELLARYPDDVYDRMWTPYNSIDWKQIETNLTIDHDVTSYNFLPLPPSNVMGTAAIPANVSDNIEFHFLPKYNACTCYVYMFFAEIQKLQANQLREFNIFVNGDILNNAPINPLHLQSVYHIAIIERPLELWINKTRRSTLPPLLNAIEIYMTKNFSQSETYQTDVYGIMNVKSIYGIKRNWQGDPCIPLTYLWDGLNCSYAESGPPRIIYLNLSSSSLIGNIAGGISNLQSIKYLDLSNNKLTGAVPEFLSQLRFLRVLNLEGNQLSGTIPMQIIVRSKNGSLESNFGGNPNLCSSGSCNNKNGNKVIVPLVAALTGAFVILIVSSTVSPQLSKRIPYSRIKEELESNKQEFTYVEVLSITRNFERVVGKGGFATVYHGWIDDTEVAVKILSPSAQGYLQFQAEAKLLAVVHHKFLTALIGYCDDGENMALIYEYMANGDLAKHLSGKNENILSWNQRLQIAVDTAEGLEYLHHGCNPPIVHRDVKSKNILLNENFRGKLADFGLSKIFPDEGDTHMTTVVAGTPGYLDPEYNRSHRLKEKSDVFSFGIVLLEIITGQPAITKTEEKTHIIQWVGSTLLEREINDIVDSRLQGEFDIDSVKKVLDTAMACVATTSINRPTMSHVVNELKQCLAKKMIPLSESDDHESSMNSLTTVSFDRISGESSLER